MSNQVSNIYKLDGRVPLSRAIPLGIQHVLAMFLGNVSPLLIAVSYTHLTLPTILLV